MSSHLFQLDMVISSVLLLCAISFGFYKIIQMLEHGMKKRGGF